MDPAALRGNLQGKPRQLKFRTLPEDRHARKPEERIGDISRTALEKAINSIAHQGWKRNCENEERQRECSRAQRLLPKEHEAAAQEKRQKGQGDQRQVIVKAGFPAVVGTEPITAEQRQTHAEREEHETSG